MGSIENTTSIKTAIMMKIILAVCLSVLAFKTVDAKKCYQCGGTSGSPLDVDTCGSFDDKTPTLTLTGDNKCWKTYAKAAGVKVTAHGCDVAAGSMCAGQKNKCRKESGTTFCCCDGDLCNSGNHLYGSVMTLLASLLAM